MEEVEHSEEKALQRFWEYLEEFDRETGGNGLFRADSLFDQAFACGRLAPFYQIIFATTVEGRAESEK